MESVRPTIRKSRSGSPTIVPKPLGTHAHQSVTEPPAPSTATAKQSPRHAAQEQMGKRRPSAYQRQPQPKAQQSASPEASPPQPEPIPTTLTQRFQSRVSGQVSWHNLRCGLSRVVPASLLPDTSVARRTTQIRTFTTTLGPGMYHSHLITWHLYRDVELSCLLCRLGSDLKDVSRDAVVDHTLKLGIVRISRHQLSMFTQSFAH